MYQESKFHSCGLVFEGFGFGDRGSTFGSRPGNPSYLHLMRPKKRRAYVRVEAPKPKTLKAGPVDVFRVVTYAQTALINPKP